MAFSFGTAIGTIDPPDGIGYALDEGMFYWSQAAGTQPISIDQNTFIATWSGTTWRTSYEDLANEIPDERKYLVGGGEDEMEEIDEFLGPSQFLKFTPENDFTIEGIFRGLKVEDDQFNPGQKRLVIDIEVDGEIRKLGTGSKRLAKKLLSAKVTPGTHFKILRFGEGFETNYEVRVVKEK